MRRWQARVAVLGGATILVCGAAGAPANADGGLVVSPRAGGDDGPIDVTTTGGCPRPATNIVVRIYGQGFPRTGENVVGNTPVGVSNDGPFTVPLTVPLRDFAAQQNPPVTLSGVYTLVLTCRRPLSPASYADYVGSVEFASPHVYKPTAKRAPAPRGERASPAPEGGAGQPPATGPAGPATRPVNPAAQPSDAAPSDAATQSANPAAAASPIPGPAPSGRGGGHGLLLTVLGLVGAGLIAGFGVLPALARRRRSIPPEASDADAPPPATKPSGAQASAASRRATPARSTTGAKSPKSRGKPGAKPGAKRR